MGVDLRSLDEHRPGRRAPNGRKLVLWNHRWEFDKAPETFARVMLRLAEESVPFDLGIAGEQGDNPSPALASLRDALPERVRHFGFVQSRAEYARLLWEADIVVSTSRHEFFGVSTVEALYCECFPVVPASQNYPALVPPVLHGACLWQDERELLELVRSALLGETRGHQRLRDYAATYDWERVAPAWSEALQELAERRQATGLQSR